MDVVVGLLWTWYIGRLAAAKGRRRGSYWLITLALWFGGEMVGALVGFLLIGSAGDLLTLYFFAILGALTGGAISWVIARSLLPAPAAGTAALGGWQPTHVVPAGGMQAWEAPDPARPPVTTLEEGLELTVEQRLGAWAQVRAANGWQGWVDGRLLRDRTASGR